MAINSVAGASAITSQLTTSANQNPAAQNPASQTPAKSSAAQNAAAQNPAAQNPAAQNPVTQTNNVTSPNSSQSNKPPGQGGVSYISACRRALRPIKRPSDSLPARAVIFFEARRRRACRNAHASPPAGRRSRPRPAPTRPPAAAGTGARS